MYSRSGLKPTMPNKKPQDDYLTNNNKSFAKKPRTLICYICGREYGTASLKIHLKTCEQKYMHEQSLRPAKDRRGLPTPPPNLQPFLDGTASQQKPTAKVMQEYNEQAFDSYNYECLEQCINCGRTFKPESLVIHQKSCTASRPQKSLPQRNTQQQKQKQTFSQPQQQSEEIEEFSSGQNLVPCSKCQRKFNGDRIQKHESICKGNKRKFKTKHMKELEQKEKERERYDKLNKKPKNNWRAKHQEFVQGMKYNRQVAQVEKMGGDIRQLDPPPQSSAITDSYIQCPHCSRRFNEQAAERHIPKCKNTINKPKALGQGIRKLPVSKTKHFNSGFESSVPIKSTSNYGQQSYNTAKKPVSTIKKQQQYPSSTSSYQQKNNNIYNANTNVNSSYNSYDFKSSQQGFQPQQQQMQRSSQQKVFQQNARNALMGSSSNQKRSSSIQKKTHTKQSSIGTKPEWNYDISEYQQQSVKNPNKQYQISNSNQSSLGGMGGGNRFTTSSNQYGSYAKGSRGFY